jgi:hypothetical protein
MCKSPQPHLHPAVSFEGEVEPCRDLWHTQVTVSNTAAKVAKLDDWFANHPAGPHRYGSLRGEQLECVQAQPAGEDS